MASMDGVSERLHQLGSAQVNGDGETGDGDAGGDNQGFECHADRVVIGG
jgi:hypothetical protein